MSVLIVSLRIRRCRSAAEDRMLYSISSLQREGAKRRRPESTMGGGTLKETGSELSSSGMICFVHSWPVEYGQINICTRVSYVLLRFDRLSSELSQRIGASNIAHIAGDHFAPFSGLRSCSRETTSSPNRCGGWFSNELLPAVPTPSRASSPSLDLEPARFVPSCRRKIVPFSGRRSRVSLVVYLYPVQECASASEIAIRAARTLLKC